MGGILIRGSDKMTGDIFQELLVLATLESQLALVSDRAFPSVAGLVGVNPYADRGGLIRRRSSPSTR